MILFTIFFDNLDPYSRRFLWNVIRQHREGRVVVLTTHFMDEADLLGDRIAIMGDGKLRCCGSSLFLKKAFGVGYNMAIEKKSAVGFNSTGMTTLVTSIVPNANLLTNVGTEMTFELPFTSSSDFPRLFKAIDEHDDELGIRSYGMSVTTLEEVFIKVAEESENHAIARAGRLSIYNDEFGGIYKGEANVDFDLIAEDKLVAYFIKHLRAMFQKRYLYFIRDLQSWLFIYIIPVVFVLTGMLVMKVRRILNDCLYLISI